MRKILIIFLIQFPLSLWAAKPFEVSGHDLLIQPEGVVSETGERRIRPLKARVGLQGDGGWIKAYLSAGSSSLLGAPRWQQGTPSEFGVVDAYGELSAVAGSVRAGQFRIPFGLEGSTEESQLWFPRSLIYSLGYWPQYDVGVSGRTDWKNFFSNLSVYQGEGAGASRTDNEFFFSGVWGYKGPARSHLGFSLASGRLDSTNNQFYGRMRAINAFFGFNIFGLGLQTEATFIQQFQGARDLEVLGWHADLEHPIFDNFDCLIRYEQLYPDRVASSNYLGRGYFGVEIYDDQKQSRFFIFGVKNWEDPSVNNDEVLISWRFAMESKKDNQ